MPASTTLLFDTTAPVVTLGTPSQSGDEIHIPFMTDELATLYVDAAISGAHEESGVDGIGPWFDEDADGPAYGVDEDGPWVEDTEDSIEAGVEGGTPWVEDWLGDADSPVAEVIGNEIVISNLLPAAYQIILYITAVDDVGNSGASQHTIPVGSSTDYILPLTLTMEADVRTLTLDPAARSLTVDPAVRTIVVEATPKTLEIAETELRTVAIEPTSERTLAVSETDTRELVLEETTTRTLDIEAE